MIYGTSAFDPIQTLCVCALNMHDDPGYKKRVGLTGMSMMTLETRYQDLCLQKGWEVDPCHQSILRKVSPIVEYYWQKKRWYQRRPPAQILYFHGAVGRGKTMLATLVYEAISVPKARWHMTAFMQHLHTQSADYRVTLPQRISTIFAPYQLLFIDELHVYEMGDAMILAQVLPLLYQHRVSMIFTSNAHPRDLYRQRGDQKYFQPIIQLLEQQAHIMEVDNAFHEDYRTRHFKRAKTSLSTGQTADVWEQFQQHHAHTPPHATELHVNDRRLILPFTSGESVFLDMDWVSENNLSAADFLAIAQKFSIVYLHYSHALLKSSSREMLQRFMILIDVLYDHNVVVYLPLLGVPQALQDTQAMSLLPFERTWSRVQELQAHTLGTLPES